MSTVSRGTSMQASSRSDEAPVNELTFNESERVASGLPAARNWRKLKGVNCALHGGLIRRRIADPTRKFLSPTHLARGPFMTKFLFVFLFCVLPVSSGFYRVVLVPRGFEMFMESCLKKLEHDAVEGSLCHLGRFADPGYRDGVNSAALGRV